jgi:SAM-dependent methyltransferase
VDVLLADRLPDWRSLNRTIDPDDEMLLFARRLCEFDRDRALLSYFESGLDLLDIVRHVARSRFGSAPVPRFLDFASGYGRLTRLLVHTRFAGTITVSDLLDRAMCFQEREFGVRAIRSAPSPDDFEPGGEYDFIFAGSLFTHLPPGSFGAWFRRLYAAARGGLLAFTVHDEAVSLEPVSGGIRFEPESESRTLDPQEYGSTWVTEDYVRDVVQSADATATIVRIPRCIGDFQDLYVVSDAPLALGPRLAVRGFVERIDTDENRIAFSGWATSVSEPCDRVQLTLRGIVIACTREFHRRGDVAVLLGDGRASASGWSVRIPMAVLQSFHADVITLSAFSSTGVERILFLGTIESCHAMVQRRLAGFLNGQFSMQRSQIEAVTGEREHALRERDQARVERDGIRVERDQARDERDRVRLERDHARCERDHTRVERDALSARIDAMRKSRFWRAREHWFRLKRTLGLTDEM